jgi:hypothetical protein
MSSIFNCFGDEENDPEKEDHRIIIDRDHSCGVLSFHRHTERALLAYVQNYCSASSTIHDILSAVDEFCTKRHWMMHIGPDKGRIVRDILQEEIVRFLQRENQISGENSTFHCVELGTYCGYSSIIIGKFLTKFLMVLLLNDIPLSFD